MGSLAFLLYPFAVLYDGVTTIRNWCYDRGLFKVTKSPIQSILVGNLSVGGTGKTPMVEYLIELLNDSQSLATLSRGYGRKTKGYIQANSTSSPSQLGDEPFQIYQKFGQEITVHVCENRLEGILQIQANAPSTSLLLLDDAFQHRRITSDLAVVLTTYDKPFTRDFLLPMGRLRESRSGAARADVIIVTKCPENLNSEQKNTLRKEIQNYTQKNTPVLFSRIGYVAPYALIDHAKWSDQVILASGIAEDSSLENYISRTYDLIEKISFGDHHDFSKSDLDAISKLWRKHQDQNPVILVTEKDAEKVKSLLKEGFPPEIPIFVQPIKIQFSIEDETSLRNLIEQKVN